MPRGGGHVHGWLGGLRGVWLGCVGLLKLCVCGGHGVSGVFGRVACCQWDGGIRGRMGAVCWLQAHG